VNYTRVRYGNKPTRRREFDLCNIARPSEQQLSSCTDIKQFRLLLPPAKVSHSQMVLLHLHVILL